MNIGPADDKIDFRVAHDNTPVRSKGPLRLILILLAVAAASLLVMEVQQRIISTQSQSLQKKLSADEAKIKDLEQKLSNCSPGVTSVPSPHK